MTNEEKALELSTNCDGEILGGNLYAARQMAKWKDEQFSKFLLWLDDNYVIRRFIDGESLGYTELIDNFKSNSYEPNNKK